MYLCYTQMNKVKIKCLYLQKYKKFDDLARSLAGSIHTGKNRTDEKYSQTIPLFLPAATLYAVASPVVRMMN